MPTTTLFSPRGFTRTVGALHLLWEVHCDPISDSYDPSETTAHELFNVWRRKYPTATGLHRIHWSVRSEPSAIFESAPFQYDTNIDGEPLEDFLSYYTPQPPINFMALPVVDKLWDAQHADTGGFIQSATGWKPSALQPFVYVPALVAAAELLAVLASRCVVDGCDRPRTKREWCSRHFYRGEDA